MEENPLRQYIDLYKAHREVLNGGSTEAMNALREEACRRLEECSLPQKGAEDYEHTDLAALLAPDYGINVARVAMKINPSDSFNCRVPNLSTSLYFLLNDAPAATDLSLRNIQPGVMCGSMREILRTHPEIAAYYGSAASLSNPVVALNTLLAQDGFVVYIPDGVKLERTVQLINILKSEMPLLAPRRILVVLGRDAQANLLVCDHTQNPEQSYLALSTVELICGPGSRLDYYDLEESSRRTSRLSALYAVLDEGADLLVDGITLHNGTTRNEYYATTRGEHCSLEILGMGILDGDRRLDTYSLIRHETPRCHSNELFKYVVDEEATGSFSGRIYVAPGSVKTEAYQANRNIVGRPSAHMFSKPQLEIYNDDVKCSHGTAIGQLDENQTFYMRSRGISEPLARILLKQAFMMDVIEGVRLPLLRDRLRMLVEMRFSGVSFDSACTACASSTDSTKL